MLLLWDSCAQEKQPKQLYQKCCACCLSLHNQHSPHHCDPPEIYALTSIICNGIGRCVGQILQYTKCCQVRHTKCCLPACQWLLYIHYLCPRQLLCFCRRLGAFAMHIGMVLLLMFLSPPLRGAGPMALMLGHEWQHIYIYIHYFFLQLTIY
jgi:hypothetical protein